MRHRPHMWNHAHMDTKPQLLTTSDVARAFGVTPKTVRAWVRDGKLPVAQRTLGGNARFSPDIIASHLNQQTGRQA